MVLEGDDVIGPACKLECRVEMMPLCQAWK